MEKTHIILFYKFINLNPEKEAEEQKELCNSIGLKGKIILAEEGINGSVAGTREQIDSYKDYMKKHPLFSDIVFKEELGSTIPFNKMKVKIKKETIRLDVPVDLSKTGKNLTPKEFLEMYNKDKDIILLDARNDYESKIGRFKGAFTPQIKTFREFTKVAELLKDKKDKKIVMYCTGGIRCEKASAYLAQEGFQKVYQVKGGIITFCQEYPNTLWEGKCFVFDDRLLSSVDPEQDLLEKCIICKDSCNLFRNCKNVTCNKRVPMCNQCKSKFNSCCSQECLNIFKESCKKKEIENRPILN